MCLWLGFLSGVAAGIVFALWLDDLYRLPPLARPIAVKDGYHAYLYRSPEDSWDSTTYGV